MSVPQGPRFLSRELSWLEFNQRILAEAADPANPLLERVKFFTIVSSNLDEFFEVRVAGLKQQVESDIVERSSDGRTASETFRALRLRVKRMVRDQFALWREELVPALASNSIRFLSPDELSPQHAEWLSEFYQTEIRPVLTPLALDQAHPFPQLLNKSLNLIVKLESEKDGTLRQLHAVVPVPRNLARVVRLPIEDEDEAERCYLLLGQIIGHYLHDLLPGTRINGYWHFRVTRNSELYIDETDALNLLQAVEIELHNRRKVAAVRLECDHDTPREVQSFLLEQHHLTENDLYLIDGPLNPVRLMAIYEGDHSPELRDRPFIAPRSPAFPKSANPFQLIRKKDILLHHPYESYDSVVDFLQSAAVDPNVLAIKQTLYRTGGDERIVGALMAAVENGKQVTAITELKARFDEANNIRWARSLESAGVHVVYGIVNLKVHAKMTLVIRRDDDGIRRYIHLATGNYNPSTAKIYTDLSLFTADPALGEDVGNLFNRLTGPPCRFSGARKLLIAPHTMATELLRLVKNETANAKAGKPARIIAKMNSLVDSAFIEAFYEASNAGVQIDLIIRGICCLRPGVPGLSENIRVRSIIGRFLEHSRIYLFHNNGKSNLYVASADLMPRNLYNRVEIVFPIENSEHRRYITQELLERQIADNSGAWQLLPTGEYAKITRAKAAEIRDSQAEFLQIARAIEKTTRRRKPAPQISQPARTSPLTKRRKKG